MRFAVIGGGNLGHALGVSLSRHSEAVSILTSDCTGWCDSIEASLPDDSVLRSKPLRVASDPASVIPEADCILLALPSHAIGPMLEKIAPFVTQRQPVGSLIASGGFFWMARHRLGKAHPLFAFHRVPFICRVKERGRSVKISGLKDELYIAGLDIGEARACFEKTVSIFERAFGAPVRMVESYLEVTISNSNPILHTSRLSSLLENPPSSEPLYFYRDWDLLSSKRLLACDEEIKRTIRALNLSFPLFKDLKSHYQVADETSMTEKIRSIKAFHDITLKTVRHRNDRIAPDPASRYFQEDVPFGLVVLKAIAKLSGVDTPAIDALVYTLQSYMGKAYLDADGQLGGSDISDTGIPQQYDILSSKQLVSL